MRVLRYHLIGTRCICVLRGKCGDYEQGGREWLDGVCLESPVQSLSSQTASSSISLPHRVLHPRSHNPSDHAQEPKPSIARLRRMASPRAMSSNANPCVGESSLLEHTCAATSQPQPGLANLDLAFKSSRP